MATSRRHLETIRSKESSQKDMRAFIASEVRGQLIEAASGKTFEKNAFPPIKSIPDSERLRILVTGGSGFVGSHLVDRLMMAGHQVTVIDNMFTGRKKNIAQWIGHPNFLLIIHDVVEPIMMEVSHYYSYYYSYLYLKIADTATCQLPSFRRRFLIFIRHFFF